MPVINLHGTPTFQGEAMLLGWAENNRDGMTVRLALDASDESGHPFKGLGTGKHGQRFMVVCVPVDDENRPAPSQGITGGNPSELSSDEMPVAGSPRGFVSGQSEQAPDRRRFEDLSRAQQAGILCGEDHFRQFIGVDTADDAKRWIYLNCEVRSRSEIDAKASQKWDNIVSEYRLWERYGDMRP